MCACDLSHSQRLVEGVDSLLEQVQLHQLAGLALRSRRRHPTHHLNHLVLSAPTRMAVEPRAEADAPAPKGYLAHRPRIVEGVFIIIIVSLVNFEVRIEERCILQKRMPCRFEF